MLRKDVKTLIIDNLMIYHKGCIKKYAERNSFLLELKNKKS